MHPFLRQSYQDSEQKCYRADTQYGDRDSHNVSGTSRWKTLLTTI